MQKLLKPFLIAVLVSSLQRRPPMHMRSLITRSGRRSNGVRFAERTSALLYPGRLVAFSSVTISGDGGAVPASKPVNDTSNQQIIHVRLGHALKPGTYTVSWHVLSVDTHRTEGSYRFTVS